MEGDHGEPQVPEDWGFLYQATEDADDEDRFRPGGSHSGADDCPACYSGQGPRTQDGPRRRCSDRAGPLRPLRQGSWARWRHRRHWPRRRHYRPATALPHGDYHDRTGRPHDHAQGAPLRLTRRAHRPEDGARNTLCVQEPGNTSVKRKHRQPGVGRVIIISGRAADISDLTEPSEAVRRRADGSGHARRAEPGQ
jgi:hypothetical protein